MSTEWMQQAACRDADPNLFFHPEQERGADRRARANAAKAVCRTCPVIMECHEYRATFEMPSLRYGVFGGLSEDDRRQRDVKDTRASRRLPREHGTHRGYSQHKRDKEQPCEPCKAAFRAYYRDYDRRRRERRRRQEVAA